MTDTSTQDPAEIERDIRRTQEKMSETVNRIGDQFTPRNILNALLDKAESNDIDARWLLDGARRNPLALAMIAGGAIWLISDSDAKLPALAPRQRSDHTTTPHHRDYISHMSGVEAQEGEDPLTYQRRRDLARSSYFMLERREDEDERGFRQRLDDAADSFRSQWLTWTDQSRKAGAAIDQTRQAAVDRAQALYSNNPLVGGLIAAALGAVLGTAIPVTRIEEEQLGEIGESVRNAAVEQKDQLVDSLREKKDQLVEASAEGTRAVRESTNR